MRSRLAVLTVFAALLAACTATPTLGVDHENPGGMATVTYLAGDIHIGDGGLFSGRPCASPCAFGVRIGETRLDQVLAVLESNGVSRCWTEPNVAWSLISCGENRFNVQVDMQTGLVNAIWFDPEVSISLGKVIEKYGAPDAVTIDRDGPGTLHPRFYWHALRMIVSLPVMAGGVYEVRKSTEVEAVDFSDKNLYRTSEKESDPYYRPWKGYGSYLPAPETWPVTPLPTVTMMP
jgi:hypothetical protein